jgi:hypothetical protein
VQVTKKGKGKSRQVLRLGQKVPMLVTASANKVFLWENVPDERTFVLSDVVSVHTPETTLTWVEDHHRVYSGNSLGKLTLWRIVFRADAGNKSDHDAKEGGTKQFRLIKAAHINAHTGIVSAIRNIASLDVVATASLDGRLCIWDTAGKFLLVLNLV